MRVGIALIIVFGANLIFSLFFFWPGESIAGRIPAIIISVAMITWGVCRIMKHKKKIDEYPEAPEEELPPWGPGKEKVLYKTKCKLSHPDDKLEEADCFITVGHVVIEGEETIKIPISRIQECNTFVPLPHIYSSGRVQVPTHNTRLTFLNDSNKKHELLLEISSLDLQDFKQAVDQAKRRYVG